ncbi:hypothetical protein BDZ94DRAFT_1311701 [Collybia nuda]|uniref:Uncharacterized protein n=1 Tax=Collybia nuda TaxID=64659 RepID=A0A9P5Y0R8_9AGAR|nr:hypothetical protein BDZ94DRAFT_1311701 [Collybia nuda]
MIITSTQTYIAMIPPSTSALHTGAAAKVSTGAIVPCVISATIAILALSLVARCIIRRHRQQRQQENSQNINIYPFSGPDMPPTRAHSISATGTKV